MPRHLNLGSFPIAPFKTPSEAVFHKEWFKIITYVAGEFVNCPIFWHVVFLVWIILKGEQRDRR